MRQKLWVEYPGVKRNKKNKIQIENKRHNSEHSIIKVRLRIDEDLEFEIFIHLFIDLFLSLAVI